MINALKNTLGLGPKIDLAKLVKNGAIIIDVRTAGEYKSGHIQCSVNIPLDRLPQSLGKLKDKDRAVITCCASGMRSASAKGILLAKGYKEVYNGGGWSSLRRKIQP